MHSHLNYEYRVIPLQFPVPFVFLCVRKYRFRAYSTAKIERENQSSSTSNRFFRSTTEKSIFSHSCEKSSKQIYFDVKNWARYLGFVSLGNKFLLKSRVPGYANQYFSLFAIGSIFSVIGGSGLGSPLVFADQLILRNARRKINFTASRGVCRRSGNCEMDKGLDRSVYSRWS